MSFFKELKRRNVFKVAAAYIIIGWLIMQAGEVMRPALHLPEWVNSLLAFFLILGFPLAMFFAWAFELTPDGLKKEKDVDHSKSIAPNTGRKLDFTIIGLLVLALGYFGYDKLVLSPAREIALIEATTKAATEQVSAEPRALTGTDKSIAVLPFVNMSSDPEQEYFSDGITEEILNHLAKNRELQVAARTSVFSFKGHDQDIRQIGEMLNVGTILEGSVRKDGEYIRITAQLIRASDGFNLWSESYDRKLENIFAIG